MNKVILVGRIGKAPEAIVIDGENKGVRFSLATSESWKDKDGNKQEKTEWHNITSWISVNFVIDYCGRGDLLAVEGSIETTKKDDKYYTSIKARKIDKLASAGVKASDSLEEEPAKQAEPEDAKEGDDVPF